MRNAAENHTQIKKESICVHIVSQLDRIMLETEQFKEITTLNGK